MLQFEFVGVQMLLGNTTCGLRPGNEILWFQTLETRMCSTIASEVRLATSFL